MFIAVDDLRPELNHTGPATSILPTWINWLGVPEALAKELIHGYYACVSYVDDQIDLVLTELERLELAEELREKWGEDYLNK